MPLRFSPSVHFGVLAFCVAAVFFSAGDALATTYGWHNDAFADTLVSGNLCSTDGTVINCNVNIVPPAQLGTGTPSSSTFLRGDGTWTTPAGGGTVSGTGSAGYGAVWQNGATLTYDSSLYIDTTGHKVGIGSTSPLNLLDVGTSGGIHIGTGTPSNTGFALYNNGGTLYWNGGALGTSGGSMVYPGWGIPNSTGSAWGTSYSTSGSGTVVALATSPTIATPTFTTSFTSPLHIGGTGTASPLTLRSTSGVGTAGADIIFQTGNNGATETMRVMNNGNVGIGTNSAGSDLQINGNAAIGYATSTAGPTNGLAVSGNVGIGTVSSSYPLYVYKNTTATSGTIPLGLNQYYVSPSSASTGTFRAVDGEVFYNGTVASTGAYLYGVFGYAGNLTNYNAGTLYGVMAQAENGGTATVSKIYGIDVSVNNNSSGTISQATAGYFHMANSGTVTTGYGVYIDTIPGSTNYGLYQASPSNQNYFAGDVDIEADLDVNGIFQAQTFVPDMWGQNDGSIDSYSIKFGGPWSGDGIASKRTAGGNQYGLDFYTNYISRMSVTNDGNVGIGSSYPLNPLDIGTAGGIHIAAGVPSNTSYALYNNGGTLTWNGTALATGGSMTYPPAGIGNSTGSAWGTSYSTTGSGTVVALATSPTFTTSIIDPKIIGGTGTTSTLALQTTSGVGTTGADMIFKVGNNGATEAMRILNSGNVGIGTTGPLSALHINKTTSSNWTAVRLMNPSFSNGGIHTSLAFDDGNGIVGAIGSLYDMTANANRIDFHSMWNGGSSTTDSSVVMSVVGNGRVGIGTTAPVATLDVAGPVVSRVYNAGSSTSIDWSNSNTAYTTASCGAFAFSNMQDGGSYTLIVQGATSGTCSFTHTGLTFKNAVTLTSTANKHSAFTFLRAGTYVYVTLITGF